MTHILTYKFHADYMTSRVPHRAAHFEYLQDYISNSELLLGGATDAATPVGYLIFNKLTKEEIEVFVKSDPYFINGIVASYVIIRWNSVAGSLIDQIID